MSIAADIELYPNLVKAVAAGGEIEITFSGNSMYPLIRDGSTCIFTQVSPSELIKGDIALFADSLGNLVGHRFYHRDEYNRYLCKGDASVTFDDPIASAQVMGRLTLIRIKGFQLRTDGLICRSWGHVIMYLPLLSRVFRRLNCDSKTSNTHQM